MPTGKRRQPVTTVKSVEEHAESHSKTKAFRDREVTPTHAKPLLDSAEDNPLFGVAMLKLALELKRDKTTPFEKIVALITHRMHLDEADFRRFLAAQGGLLRTLARARPN